MTINLIACYTLYKNKLAIGKSNNLLFNLKKDMEMFKNITTNQLNKDSILDKNVVVMGRNTWYSIPQEKRPLSNRINIVLTNDKELQKTTPYPSKKDFINKTIQDMYFMSFKQFTLFYKYTNANIWIIGGGTIYNLFLNNQNEQLLPQNVYMTEVKCNFKFEQGFEPDIFMEPLTWDYKLIGTSEKYIDKNIDVSYRFLTFKRFPYKHKTEMEYLNLCKEVLHKGKERIDRTEVGTISIFGNQLHFDISQNVPLLTSKQIPWKTVIEELLWFMRGDTDNKILQKKGVHIWNGNTSREFLDSRGLNHYDEGILGPGYGWQMRFFGAKYSQHFADTQNLDIDKIGGFDQLKYIEHELLHNPYSRRIMMCYWNPPDFDKTCLLPCHFFVQFYVEDSPTSDKKILNAHFGMRSTDVFLGLPFNIFSYTVLTYILALKCNMEPGKLIYTGSDIHIYKNHIEQVNKQLQNTPRPLPKLILNSDIKYKDWKYIDISDFDIVGYFPNHSIKASMAI
jgi:thymidylate synthase